MIALISFLGGIVVGVSIICVVIIGGNGGDDD